MSGFKVHGKQEESRRKVLLPLSLGASSLSLLHLLHHHVERQIEKTDRRAYDVHVLYVDESVSSTGTSRSDRLEELNQHYPLHFYHSCHINDILLQAEGDGEIRDLLLRLGFTLDQTDPTKSLESYLASLPSASSVEDISTIIRSRLIIHKAKEVGCDTILWGDSTTRLAERTLAETAKGRGVSLPWQINDTSLHGVGFMYPLKELFRKELRLFAGIAEPLLRNLIQKAPSTDNPSYLSKNSNIAGLMARYFESVEQDYPNVVANVTKTVGKLGSPPDFENLGCCSVCNLPIAKGIEDMENFSDAPKEHAAKSKEHVRFLCYGCRRSVEGLKSIQLNNYD